MQPDAIPGSRVQASDPKGQLNAAEFNVALKLIAVIQVRRASERVTERERAREREGFMIPFFFSSFSPPLSSGTGGRDMSAKSANQLC